MFQCELYEALLVTRNRSFGGFPKRGPFLGVLKAYCIVWQNYHVDLPGERGGLECRKAFGRGLEPPTS